MKKSIFLCLIAIAVLVLSPIAVYAETVTADVTEKFAPEYMPATKAVLDKFSKIRSDDRAMLDSFNEELRLVGVVENDRFVFANTVMDAYELLVSRRNGANGVVDEILKNIKDTYFKYQSELIEVDDVSRIDSEIAKEYDALYSKVKTFQYLYYHRDNISVAGKYIAIDLNFGIVESLDDIPKGGWSYKDKTRRLILRRIEEGEKSFYIGVFEVTKAQYKTVVGKDPSSYGDILRPVETVSWSDTTMFCRLMNSEFENLRFNGGYGFVLPTAAQWEYACRAGTTTELNNGTVLTSEDDFCLNLNQIAWYNKNSDNITHPMGLKKPNAWGLYDMSGNVFEWCEDANGSGRIVRGGSWNGNASCCRSSCSRTALDNGLDCIGFRVVLCNLYDKLMSDLKLAE